MTTNEGHTKFKNDRGIPEIRVGIKDFMCAGVSAPLDHPHVFLQMGSAETIICPYCATLFRYDPQLGADEVDPPDSLFLDVTI